MQQQTNLNEKTSILQALKESPFVSETYIQPYRNQKQMQDEDLLQYEDQTKPQQLSNQQQEYQPLESYIISKTLGKGNFGKVKLAMHKLTQQYVAVKILQKDLIFQNTDIVRITRELKIMKKLRHPFVVQLYQIIETAKQLYLIMEYAEGGDLFQKIVDEERIKQTQAARIYTQIVLGMDYFHSKGVTHRDLKPQNILMSKDGTIKIADFGLGNMFKPQEKLKTACGSPCYASPQMLNREPYDPKKIDIWSSGIILYAMVCGYLPFEDQVTAKLYEKIKTSNVKLPSWVSSPCRNLIRGLLTKDPKLRFDVESILSHEMITPHLESLKQMIKERQLTENKIQEICEMYDIEEKEKLLSDLNKNRHNNLTTVYYLAVKKIGKQEKEKPLYYQNDMREIKKDEDENVNSQSQIVQQIQNKQQPKTQMISQQADQAINENEIQKTNVQMMGQIETNGEDKQDKCKDSKLSQRNQQQIKNISVDENNKNIQSKQKRFEQYKSQGVQNPFNQQIATQPQALNEDKDKQPTMQIEQNTDNFEDREVNDNQGQKQFQDDKDRMELDQQKMQQQQEDNMLSDEQLQVHRLHEEGNYELEDVHFNEQPIMMMDQDNQERIRDAQQQQSLHKSQSQMDKQKDLIELRGDQDKQDEQELIKVEDKVQDDKVEDKKIQIQQQQQQQKQQQAIPEQQQQGQNLREYGNRQDYSVPESIIEQSYQLSMEIQKTLQQLNQMANLQNNQVNVNDRQNTQNNQNTYQDNQQTHIQDTEINHLQMERTDEKQNVKNDQIQNVRNQDMQTESLDKMQNESLSKMKSESLDKMQSGYLSKMKSKQIDAEQTNKQTDAQVNDNVSDIQVYNNKLTDIQVNNNKVSNLQVSQLDHDNVQQHIHPQSMPMEQQDNVLVTNNYEERDQLVQEDSKECQKLTEVRFVTNYQHKTQHQPQHQPQSLHQPQPQSLHQPQHQQIVIKQNHPLQQIKSIPSQVQQPHLNQQKQSQQINNSQIQPHQIKNQLDAEPQNITKQRYQIQAKPINSDQHNFIKQQQPIKSQSNNSNTHSSNQVPNTQIITSQSQQTPINQLNQQIHIQNQPSQLLTPNLSYFINNQTQTNPLQQQQQQPQQQIPSNIQKTSQQSQYQTHIIPHQQNIDLQQAQLIQQIQIIQTAIYKKQPQQLKNNTTKQYINPNSDQLKNYNQSKNFKPQNKLLRQNNKKNHLFSTDQVLPLKQQTQKINREQQKQTTQNKHQPVNSKIQVKNILAARNIRLNQRSHSKDTPIIFKSNKNKPTLKPQPIKDNKKKSLSKQKNPKFTNKPIDPKQKKSQQKQPNSSRVQKKQPVRQKFVIAKDKKPQRKQKLTPKEQSKVKSTETLKYEKKTAIQKSQKQDQKMFKTIGITAIKQQPQVISNKIESKSRLKSTSLISESSKRFSGYGIKFKKNTNDQSKQHNIPISPISGIKTKDVSTPFNSIKLAFQHQQKTLVSNLKQQEEQNSSPLSQKEKEKSEVKKIQICKPKTFYENVKTKSFSQYSNMSSTLTNNSSSKIGISKYSQNSPGQSKLNKTIGSFSHRSKESDMKQRSLLSSQKQKIFDNFGIKSNNKFDSQYSQSNLNSNQVNNESQNDFVINFSHVEPQLINSELIIFVSVQELYHLIESISQSKSNTFSNIIGTLSVYQYPTKDYMYVLNSNLFKSQQIPANNKKSQTFSHNKSSPSKKRTKIGTFEFVELINSIVLSD